MYPKCNVVFGECLSQCMPKANLHLECPEDDLFSNLLDGIRGINLLMRLKLHMLRKHMMRFFMYKKSMVTIHMSLVTVG